MSESKKEKQDTPPRTRGMVRTSVAHSSRQGGRELLIEIDPGSATTAEVERFLEALSALNEVSGGGVLKFEVKGISPRARESKSGLPSA
jgi:hypothetical protein